MRMGSPAGPDNSRLAKRDDSDAAPLLLGEAVGIDAGQSPHQGALAVIDMTCGAHDNGLHNLQFTGEFLNS